MRSFSGSFFFGEIWCPKMEATIFFVCFNDSNKYYNNNKICTNLLMSAYGLIFTNNMNVYIFTNLPTCVFKRMQRPVFPLYSTDITIGSSWGLFTKTKQKTNPKTTHVDALVWGVYACRGVKNKAYLNRTCMTKAHLKCMRSRHVVCEHYLKLTPMVVETMLQLLHTR